VASVVIRRQQQLPRRNRRRPLVVLVEQVEPAVAVDAAVARPNAT
jgi:hypothetical protein